MDTRVQAERKPCPLLTTGADELTDQLLQLLFTLFSKNTISTDWSSITTLWIQSNNAQSCGAQLVKMLNDENLPEAYQIGFDLAEAGSQAFVLAVRNEIQTAGAGPEEGTVSDEDSWPDSS
jgi:hypothetical protein